MIKAYKRTGNFNAGAKTGIKRKHMTSGLDSNNTNVIQEIILEEQLKGNTIILVYDTSPLGLEGYITYRVSQCIILSVIELIILALFGIVTRYNYLLRY